MMNSRYHTTEQAYAKANQRVSSTGNDKSEDFLWDGLALIHRGKTSFINEPYVSGGNPVMAPALFKSKILPKKIQTALAF